MKQKSNLVYYLYFLPFLVLGVIEIMFGFNRLEDYINALSETPIFVPDCVESYTDASLCFLIGSVLIVLYIILPLLLAAREENNRLMEEIRNKLNIK